MPDGGRRRGGSGRREPTMAKTIKDQAPLPAGADERSFAMALSAKHISIAQGAEREMSIKWGINYVSEVQHRPALLRCRRLICNQHFHVSRSPCSTIAMAVAGPFSSSSSSSWASPLMNLLRRAQKQRSPVAIGSSCTRSPRRSRPS